MRGATVYIDESGTLPDPKDKVIVIAAVTSDSESTIQQLARELKKISKSKNHKGELKFYKAGDKTKTAVLEAIAKNEISIFILSVEKMGRKIPDTPEHFALLCWLLLTDVLSFYQVTDIVLDRHFFRKKDLLKFNNNLTELFNIDFDIRHVDSKSNKKVNIADMIAGSVLLKETRGNGKFYKLIEKRIINYKKLNWVKAKRRLFEK